MLERYHGLDFLRAFMMGLGLVLHTAQLYLSMPIVDYYWDSARSVSMDVLLIFINTFRMPTFYMMAGFFTAMLLARRGLHGMLDNRVKRILLPFLVFLPPMALIMTALRVVAYHVMETGELGWNTQLVPSNVLCDNTHNLWFLYYLLMFVCTAWVLQILLDRAPTKIVAWLKNTAENTRLNSVLGIVFFAAVLGAIGSTSESGRITAHLSFAPYLSVYLYFGVCFTMGWILFQQVFVLKQLAERCWTLLGLAVLSLCIGLVGFAMQGDPNNDNYKLFHWLLSIATGMSMTLFMLGFTGLFHYYFKNFNPWIRYFSDSAYWVFIFHSIPLIVFALPLANIPLIAELKFAVVLSLTTAFSLVTYQLFVRNTVIGKFLNGRRYSDQPWRV